MFDKIDKKFFILGRNKSECHRKVTATNKQNKIGQMNTNYCAKKQTILIYMLAKSNIPEDIKMEIEAEFEVNVVEHK